MSLDEICALVVRWRRHQAICDHCNASPAPWNVGDGCVVGQPLARAAIDATTAIRR